jgi:hypothetical protein
MASQTQHDDIVVEIYRSQVKLLANLANLAIRKTKTFFKTRTTIMLSNRVLIALFVVFDADALEVSLFEDAVLDEILTVKATDSLKCVVEVLPHTHYLVLFENEAIATALVETLLIPEESLIAQIQHCWLISRYFLLLPC